MKEFYLYILESVPEKCYYIGATSDLKQRIQRHNLGKVKSTKSRKPWKLKYREIFSTFSEARKRETQLKSWKKRANIEKLFSKNATNV